jgi:hypothetical protein
MRTKWLILIALFILTALYLSVKLGRPTNAIDSASIEEIERHFIEASGGGVKDTIINAIDDTTIKEVERHLIDVNRNGVKDTLINTIDDTTIKEVERHLIDVNGDDVKDTLILECADYCDEAIETFNNIRIKTSKGESYSLKNVKGYRNYTKPIEDLLPFIPGETYKFKQRSDGSIYMTVEDKGGTSSYTLAKVNRDNLVHSNYIYVLEQTSNGIVMLVWGFSYGDCSKEFAVIQFHNGAFISNEIEDRVISSVSLSDSGDKITIQGYRSCEKEEEMETFYIPVAK